MLVKSLKLVIFIGFIANAISENEDTKVTSKNQLDLNS
jgi:hypothetical protein